MATHNQVRIMGYLLNNAKILNEGIPGAEKVLFPVRTVRRDIEGYNGKNFEDVMVYYDGTEYMEKMKKLIRFDVVDIKGVFNVLTLDKRSTCPSCGTVNIKSLGSSTFVYPISFYKINALERAYDYNEQLPEELLIKHYKETSNQALIIGTVVSSPEPLGTEKHPSCRYRLGVDRKYFIKTQSDITADYPWVYTYGQQALRDLKYLQLNAEVLVDGFMRNRQVKSNIICETCGRDYQYPDVATEFVPYSVEYLNGHKTDADIAAQSNSIAMQNAIHAEKMIFG